MKVEDYFHPGPARMGPAAQKGDKSHDVPANYNRDQYLEA